MKTLYVSEESLKAAIDYFAKIHIQSPEQLGMFFFFKSIGFDESSYHSFPKVSGITDSDRKEYLKKYVPIIIPL